MNGNWKKRLPSAPLNAEEIKQVGNGKHENNELSVIRMLKGLGSECASIVTALGSIRRKVKAPLLQVREKHADHGTLLRILSGARFEYFFMEYWPR